MAARYWVGGSGTWNNVSTTNWSLTSGGASGASAPTINDNVIFDANSGLGGNPAITIAQGAVCGGCVISGLITARVTFQFTYTAYTWGAGVYSFQGAVGGTVMASNPVATRVNLTLNGTHGTHSDINFRDINLLGTAGTLSGTRIGDGGGNSGITFTPSQTQTCLATGSFNWADPTKWSGGRAPLPQDDVLISLTGGTITVDTLTLGRDLDFTGSTAVLAGTQACFLYGSLKLAATLANPTINITIALGGRGTHTLDLAGKNLVNSFNINAGGTYTLLSHLVTTLNLFCIPGTFNTNGFNVTCATFASAGTLARTLILTGSTFTLTGTGIVLNINQVAGSGGLTLIGSETATFILTDTSATLKTFQQNGNPYGTLRYVSAGTGGLQINAQSGTGIPGTLSVLDVQCSSARSLTVVGTINILTALTLQGASGQLLSVAAVTPGTPVKFSLSSGAAYTRAFTSFSADIQTEFNELRSAGLVLGGTCVTTFPIVYNLAPDGGLVLGGSATSKFSNYAVVPRGGVVLGGSLVTDRAYVAAVSGGVVLGGTCTSTVALAPRYSDTPVGGIILGGDAHSARHVVGGLEPTVPVPLTLTPTVAGARTLAPSPATAKILVPTVERNL